MVKSCFLPVADGSILSAAAVLVLLVLARGVVFPCVAGSPIVLDVMLEKFLHDLLLRVTRSLRCFPGAVLTTPGAWAHSRGWDPSSASPRPGLTRVAGARALPRLALGSLAWLGPELCLTSPWAWAHNS